MSSAGQCIRVDENSRGPTFQPTNGIIYETTKEIGKYAEVASPKN